MHRLHDNRRWNVPVAFLFLAVGWVGSAAVRGQEHAAPMLLVANAADSTLAIVDAATLRLVGHVSTGEEPHEVVTSPDGRFAFVSNYGTSTRPGSTLSVIDVIARKEVRRVDLGALLRPHGLYRSDGKIYFTAGGSRTVARYDPHQGRVDWMMGTGQDVSHLLVVTDNGRKIYTSNMGSNTVTVLTFHDGLPPRLPAEQGSPAIKQISTGSGPEALDLSPDGRELRGSSASRERVAAPSLRAPRGKPAQYAPRPDRARSGA
jgi:hypothetical protein